MSSSVKYEIGELYWATLENWPIWPAITYERDDTDLSGCVSERKTGENRGKKRIFLVFLSKTPSSNYVEENNLEKFDGSKRAEYLDARGRYFSSYPGWMGAVKSALDEFLPLQKSERIKLIEEKIKSAAPNPNAPRLYKSENGVDMGEYCRCKSVMKAHSKKSTNGRMLGCSECGNFYHPTCVNMIEFPSTPHSLWVCEKCLNDADDGESAPTRSNGSTSKRKRQNQMGEQQEMNSRKRAKLSVPLATQSGTSKTTAARKT